MGNLAPSDSDPAASRQHEEIAITTNPHTLLREYLLQVLIKPELLTHS